ncbi:MAG: hypothetical protein H6581_10585 [Bacteroidia bacterium]|nr:hypothetical protein [Bacteroidia bacterium]
MKPLLPLYFALSVALLVFACRQPGAAGISDSMSSTLSSAVSISYPPTKPSNSFEGAFTLAKAMNLIFGNWDEESQTSIWSFNDQEKYLVESETIWTNSKEDLLDTDLISNVLFSEVYPMEEGYGAYLVSQIIDTKAGVDWNAHVYSAKLGFHWFERKGNLWELKVSQRFAKEMGEYGQQASPTLIQLGENNWGLDFPLSYGGTGEHNEGNSYVAVVDDTMQVVFANLTHWFYMNAEENYPEWSGTIELTPKPGKKWYPIKYSRKGTEIGEPMYLDNDQPNNVQVNETIYFEFNGEKYERI